MVEKNVLKLKARTHRIHTMFNTGTRSFKSKKDYNRRDNKVNLTKINY